MNLKETQELLTMLWSLYPNAPKLTREDKEAMAVAWLGVLYEFSLEDAWRATKKCFEHEPRFVPSAPEILAKCEKHYDVDKFLSADFNKLSETVDQSWNAERERYRILKQYAFDAPKTPEEQKELEKAQREQETCQKLDELWSVAYAKARTAYEQKEMAKLAEDGAGRKLKQLAML